MAFFLTYRPPMATLGEHIRQSNAYKWWILGMIMLGTFMAVLDVTVVNVGLPAIMSAFGIGISTAEWVITAYMITMTVMLPSAGWFADRFGNKRIYIVISQILCRLLAVFFLKESLASAGEKYRSTLIVYVPDVRQAERLCLPVNKSLVTTHHTDYLYSTVDG